MACVWCGSWWDSISKFEHVPTHSHRLEVRGLHASWCSAFLVCEACATSKVVHWVFKHRITRGRMHAVVLLYDITRVCLSLWAHEVVVDQLNVQQEREVNLTNKDGSFWFVLCICTEEYVHVIEGAKRILYICVITSLHVGTFWFTRQVPHQTCTLYWYSNITQYHASGGCPIYWNSHACGASIRGHARLSSITLTQSERG